MGALCRGVNTAGEDVLWTGLGYRCLGDGSGFMDPHLQKKESVRKSLRAAAEVMRRSQGRPPHLNCFGLHEWAMLYRPDGTSSEPRRHQSLPLRLSQAELNAVVEGQPIACTHFDAFRFFVPEAVPLNTVDDLTRSRQAELEQPGCVHATMDLFRYSIKLWPWVPSELLADALELAISARVLDMRASPYDLSAYDEAARTPRRSRDSPGSLAPIHSTASFDFSPIRIESEAGRREYQRIQSSLATRAAPVRRRLLLEYDHAIAAWDA